jgi:hypothetical protein
VSSLIGLLSEIAQNPARRHKISSKWRCAPATFDSMHGWGELPPGRRVALSAPRQVDRTERAAVDASAEKCAVLDAIMQFADRQHQPSEVDAPLFAAQPSTRLRFSLRSLWILLTVACVLFGFVVDAYHTVQTRKFLMNELYAHGTYVIKPFGTPDEINSWYKMHRLVPPRRRGVSLLRQFFGDAPVVLVEPRNDMDPAMIASMRRFFPEAIFIKNGRQALD